MKFLFMTMIMEKDEKGREREMESHITYVKVQCILICALGLYVPESFTGNKRTLQGFSKKLYNAYSGIISTEEEEEEEIKRDHCGPITTKQQNKIKWTNKQKIRYNTNNNTGKNRNINNQKTPPRY